MRALCDVNVLLAIALPTHENNSRATEWLAKQSSKNVAVCRITQSGVLRLLTEPKMMGSKALTMGQAWVLYDRLMSDTRLVFVEEPQDMERLWRKLCPPALVAPHLWTDAYLAAFAAAGGMRLVTFDKGFRRFVGLDVLILGQPPAVHEQQPAYQIGF